MGLVYAMNGLRRFVLITAPGDMVGSVYVLHYVMYPATLSRSHNKGDTAMKLATKTFSLKPSDWDAADDDALEAITILLDDGIQQLVKQIADTTGIDLDVTE